MRVVRNPGYGSPDALTVSDMPDTIPDRAMC